MIVRLVKMTFHLRFDTDFEEMFNERKHLIAACEGCHSVELLKEKNTNSDGSIVYFTRSKWDSEEYLEKYRKSELFEATWRLTKTFFSAKPQAWTLEIAK
jgi:heme-degrading monooxygenase HmoA